jgi:hypothetical protein
MGVSGQHNASAWDFIQQAVTVTHIKGVTHLAVYYFWIKCEHQLGIDASFQPFLGPEIKGSTVEIGKVETTKSDSGSCGQKQKGKSEFAETTSHLTSLMSAQEAQTKTMEQMMLAKEEREKDRRSRHCSRRSRQQSRNFQASRLSHWEAKVKVTTISDDKVALKALYEEADKFD